MTFSDVQRLQAEAGTADVPLAMDEDAFRAFYDRTAPPLLAYLCRISGDRQLADDLLQESYYRLLKTREVFESDAHRRHYLYRIATNLVHDCRRGIQRVLHAAEPVTDIAAAPEDREARADVRRAMSRLKPRERALLWLAYAQGASHGEIATVLGVKTGSVKLLLFRARRKMAGLLRARQDNAEGRS
jgi:RNA polymerase sigma-70 factor (ECF subfamily)